MIYKNCSMIMGMFRRNFTFPVAPVLTTNKNSNTLGDIHKLQDTQKDLHEFTIKFIRALSEILVDSNRERTNNSEFFFVEFSDLEIFRVVSVF